MKWGLAILIWFAVLALEACGLGFYGHPTHCYQIGFPSELFVVETESGIKVLNEEEYQTQYTDFDEFFDSSGIWVSCRPQRSVGPWWDVIELYTTTWYMTDAQSLRIGSFPDFNKKKRTEVFEAVVEYARTDPILAQFNPGNPPVRTYHPENFIRTGIELLMFFGIPTAFALVGERLYRFCGNETEHQRRHAGLCIHCTYDCRNLPTATCPECGQPHTVPIESPLLESHA